MTNNSANFRKKRSEIWFIDKFLLQEIVKASNSITEILKYFELSNKGGNYKTLQKRLIEDGIDFSHIKLGSNSNKGRKFPDKEKIPLEFILIENSTYGRTLLKKRLLKEGLLKNQCYICGQLPEWNCKPLSLQIDHINGISNDNRLENLRILCPHCHSQTDTFAGKSLKKERPPRPSELDPDWRKSPKPQTRKVDRPSKEELEKLLWIKPTQQLAKDFGVSDKAIEKWAKVYGLTKPPRGYWQKKAA